jgi:putative protein-disulfide isomerase
MPADETAASIAFDFLFDPLCGWCYGAAPTIAAVRAAFPVRFRLYPIGLFHKESVRPMDAGIAQYIRQADQRLSEMTGQPIGKDYTAKLVVAGAPDLNSAPAIRAILAAEALSPGKGLDLQEALQKARFVDGRDITDPAEIARITGEHGIGLEKAMTDAEADRCIAESRQHLAHYGMNGVPALVLRGTGDREGQLDLPLPNQLLYAREAAVDFIHEQLKARGA